MVQIMIYPLRLLKRGFVKVIGTFLPRWFWLTFYQYKISKYALPADLKEMVSDYFSVNEKYVSRLWIHLMAFHLKRIEDAYKCETPLKKVMEYISRHYTLRFKREEHLQEIRRLYPSNELVASDPYSEIANGMTNILTTVDQKEKRTMLTHEYPQDQIQSAIEIEYIQRHVELNELDYIVEIGAGYGRIPEYLSSKNKLTKYIIVDIPPALWVSQTYLSNVFLQGKKKLKVAQYTRQLTKEQLIKRIDNNDILFITPEQMSFLPTSRNALAIAINCLQEMPKPTIEKYFRNLSRSAIWFYIKAQKEPHNPWQDSFLNFAEYLDVGSWNIISNDTVVFPKNYKEGMLKSADFSVI